MSAALTEGDLVDLTIRSLRITDITEQHMRLVDGHGAELYLANNVRAELVLVDEPEVFEPPTCPHRTTDVEACAEGGHDQ